MKIQTKIVLPIFIAITVILSLATFYSYFYSAENLKERIFAHLETTAQSRAHNIETQLEMEKELIQSIALIGKIEKLLLTSGNDSSYDEQVLAVNERLQKIVNSIDHVLSVRVLDKDNILIASTDPELIGSDYSESAFFKENPERKTEIKFVDDPDLGVVLGIVSPIYNQETNEYLGMVGGITSFKHFNEIVLDKTGLGETGETYLINEESYAISPLAQTENVILEQKIDTVNSSKCFSYVEDEGEHEEHEEGHIKQYGEESVEIFPDYIGNSVIGTHVHIPEMGWCLLAEIDESEAMISIKNQLIFAITSILIVFVILFATIYFVAKYITKPITLLKEGTAIIGKGNLDYKVGTDSDDEVGQLSRSFDEMTKAIKKSRAEVDQKVEDQTKEIRKNADQISKDKNKIETIIQGIGDGVFVVDVDLKITLFNPVASRMSGFSEKEALGEKYQNVLKFVYESDTDKVNDKFIKDAIATGKPQSMSNHTLLITKKGKQISVADSAAPLINKKGQIVGCVVVFRDATKEREIDRMKTEFVSVASHQLKTPLTGIKWMSELLLREKLNSKQKEYALDVNTSANKLTKLVDNLLNVSHIETGKKFDIEKVNTNVIKLIDSAIKIVEKNNNNKKIPIVKSKETPSKLIINIDPGKIKQAISNLIDNAVKYSKQGGTIEVSCLQNEDGIMLSVKDNGIGIPLKQQDRIFEKFFRADNVVQYETGGTGLGLYIVKAIIEAHGGKIWFESDENEGTTFYAELPVK